MEQNAQLNQNNAPLDRVEVAIEHARDGFGIGTGQPRISWIIHSERSSWMQSGYEAVLFGMDGKRIAQTGRIASNQSILNAWPFPALRARERVGLRVRVWSTDGHESVWSDLIQIETALLAANDWQAKFIAPQERYGQDREMRLPLLRYAFTLRDGVQSARLYVTALGVYELLFNGKKIGNHFMAPGWTSYLHRLRYDVFDVTGELNSGGNVIGAMIANGWYRGRLGFGGGRSHIYGDDIALLAQLEVTYRDGSRQIIGTNESWRAAEGPILSAEIYDGEQYDARLEKPGWQTAGYDDHEWHGTRMVDWDFSTLFAANSPAIERLEQIAPRSIEMNAEGKSIVDFGQNIVGVVQIQLSGAAGDRVTIRHAEMLEGCELCVRPLRTARATDSYTLRGDSPETWSPRFTFHGFRYVSLEYSSGGVSLESINAVVVSTNLEQTGWFACSNPDINQLHENVVWSMRGNFVGIPTDCPQRDERLGWTGDIQVFSPTASFLYDTFGFLSSWLQDLSAEQKALGGLVPVVIPNIIVGPPFAAAAWSDAATVLPWVLYQRYADRNILEKQFESMRAWVDWIGTQAEDDGLWSQGFQFGDWLDPSAPPDQPGKARTNASLVATAYYAHSAVIVAECARILGLQELWAHYEAIAERVKKAFCCAFVTPAGRMMSDSQTAYSLAILFNLLETPQQIAQAGERLKQLLRDDAYHIGTGFVGTPLICDALCRINAPDAAYRLLLQRECPSWLYPVTMGATTIWERWDSILPDGRVNPGEMTSLNHYALGAVADWMHRTIGGIAPEEPGYQKIRIQPRPGGGMTYGEAKHRSPYGMVECRWNLSGKEMQIKIRIPANTSATVVLPGSRTEALEVGSGTYQYSYTYQDPASHERVSTKSAMYDILDRPDILNRTLSVLSGYFPDPFFAQQLLLTQQKRSLEQVLSAIPRGREMLSEIRRALNEEERTEDAREK